MMKQKHYTATNGGNSGNGNQPVVVSFPAPLTGGFSLTFAVSF